MDIKLLKEHIDFNTKDGKATWKVPTTNRVSVGDLVGTLDKGGYVVFFLKGKQYKMHRVLYYIKHGYLPKYIDHINGNRRDNREVNLRGATMTQNNRNVKRQCNNTSGVTGVSWSNSRKKWVATIWHEGKPIPLGRYMCKEEAIQVRKEAEVLYGYHPNHGR